MNTKPLFIYFIISCALMSCKEPETHKERLYPNLVNLQKILDQGHWVLKEYGVGKYDNIILTSLYFNDNDVIFDQRENTSEVMKIDLPYRVILNDHIDELFNFNDSYFNLDLPTEQDKKVIGYFTIESEKMYIEISRSIKNRFILPRLIEKLNVIFIEKTKENLERTNYIRL